MSIAKGVSLGPYEILTHIGAGGMGDVWRARDRRIGRDVAVKVLPDSFGAGDELVRRFEQEHDDYNAIMVQALGDRLSEAFAELMHARVRKEFWGYAADEDLNNEALIREEYHGIRPAPGYPACPEHTEKGILWDLLDAEKNSGIKLTESYAMSPGSAVSGFYFSHPASRYFGVGQIGREQASDYASRKGMSLEEAEKWLAPNLTYDPER